MGRGENVESSFDRPSRRDVPRQPVCQHCGAVEETVKGGIGLEDTFKEHVDNLMEVFDECWRVLKDDGVFYLNYGDAYKGSGRGAGSIKRGTLNRGNVGSHDLDKENDKSFNIPSKSLMLMPFRIAIEMQDRGWILRSRIPWIKPNPMPESTKDRPTNAHEEIFMFVKRRKYYWDGEAVKTPMKEVSVKREQYGRNNQAELVDADAPKSYQSLARPDRYQKPSGWATSDNYREAIPGRPKEKRKQDALGKNTYTGFNDRYEEPKTARMRNYIIASTESFKGAHFATYPTKVITPLILSGSKEGDVVLDMFGGSGTTGLVANRLHRNSVLIEISSEYAEMARDRIYNEAPMLNEVEVIKHETV